MECIFEEKMDVIHAVLVLAALDPSVASTGTA